MGAKHSRISGSALCLPCGMCCDGSLFALAAIKDEEKPFVATLGMVVVQAPQMVAFQMPCPLFQNGDCSIYQQRRPMACSHFSCKLLQDYEKEKISLEEGLEKIRRAREMLSRVGQLAPGKNGQGDKTTLREVVRQLSILSSTTVDERRQHFQFLMEAAKCEMFLRTNFLSGWQKKNMSPENLPEMNS